MCDYYDIISLLTAVIHDAHVVANDVDLKV